MREYIAQMFLCMYIDACAPVYSLCGCFCPMPIRVDAFLSVALMNWCHVIRAQGGCITYEHDDDDDDDDDTYIYCFLGKF